MSCSTTIEDSTVVISSGFSCFFLFGSMWTLYSLSSIWFLASLLSVLIFTNIFAIFTTQHILTKNHIYMYISQNLSLKQVEIQPNRVDHKEFSVMWNDTWLGVISLTAFYVFYYLFCWNYLIFSISDGSVNSCSRKIHDSEQFSAFHGITFTLNSRKFWSWPITSCS